MYPRSSITNPEPAPSTGTGSIKKSYSVAFVRMFATAGDVCRYTRTLMDSSSVSAASRAATSAALFTEPDPDSRAVVAPFPDGGSASTLTGCRCPHRAPAQYAASNKIAHTRISRAPLDPLACTMIHVLPDWPHRPAF